MLDHPREARGASGGRDVQRGPRSTRRRRRSRRRDVRGAERGGLRERQDGGLRRRRVWLGRAGPRPQPSPPALGPRSPQRIWGQSLRRFRLPQDLGCPLSFIFVVTRHARARGQRAVSPVGWHGGRTRSGAWELGRLDLSSSRLRFTKSSAKLGFFRVPVNRREVLARASSHLYK